MIWLAVQIVGTAILLTALCCSLVIWDLVKEWIHSRR